MKSSIILQKVPVFLSSKLLMNS